MKTYKEFILEGQVRFSKEMYKGVKDNNGMIIPDWVLDDLISSDPSSTKSYSKWIIDSYLKSSDKPVFLEDLYKVTEYLQTYEKMKKKNLIDKDIFKFKDYKDLFLKMKEVGGIGVPDDDEKYLVEDRYYINNGEAKVYYEDDHYLIVIPKTYNASKFYAFKTEWCTKFPDQYKKYSSEGDLYIIIDKTRIAEPRIDKGSYVEISYNDKYRLLQFHMVDYNKSKEWKYNVEKCYDFMDCDDTKVPKEKRIEFVDIFKDIEGSFVIKYDYVMRSPNNYYIVNDLSNKYPFNDIVHIYQTSKFSMGQLEQLNYRIGVLDSKGKVIIPLMYNHIECEDSHYIVSLITTKPDKHWSEIIIKHGLYNEQGKLIIPIEYDTIAKGRKGSFILSKDGEITNYEI